MMCLLSCCKLPVLYDIPANQPQGRPPGDSKAGLDHRKRHILSFAEITVGQFSIFSSDIFPTCLIHR